MAKVFFITEGIDRANALHQNLEERGYEVVQFANVVSALEATQATSVRLIVCQDFLGNLGAIDLLEIRRSEPSLVDIPVVVFGETDELKVEAYRKGCDDFISFPISSEELALRLSVVLKRESREGVNGDFEHISLLDLLQMLLASRGSGAMEVVFEQERGLLGINQGQVTYAQNGSVFGEDAFLAILKNSQIGGLFSFLANGTFPQPNIDKRTDHLLLGLANIIDES